MSIEDRVANLEHSFLALYRLMKRADEWDESLSESTKLLTEMIQRHEERFGRTEPKQSNEYTRLAVLADVHIKTEEALTKLMEQLDRFADNIERHIKEGH
jgi:iron-sulfur cluster repair protein YtfE (RIC family)